jgi:PPM family protein phosphatase
MLVADGMGGHASGEVASRLAVESIREIYEKERSEQDVLTALKSALEITNFTILQKSLEREDLNGMGTTGTVLVLKEEQAYIGHVGDSRAYLFRDSTLSQLTKDHSLVERMVEQGLISREEAGRHPQRNVIYQTLGVNRDLDPQLLGPIPLFPADTFLLCTDGLSNLVSDQEMLETVMRNPPQKACQELIDLANQRGGHDNITLQILKVKGEIPKPRKRLLEGKRYILVMIISILSLLFIVNGLSLVRPDWFKKIQTEIEGWWK